MRSETRSMYRKLRSSMRPVTARAAGPSSTCRANSSRHQRRTRALTTAATADSRWSAAWLAASTASSYGGRRRIQPVRRGAEQGAGELSARADTQLAEHFLQVVLDRIRAHEQPCRDLAVRQAFRDEPGDPCLLGRELVDGL